MSMRMPASRWPRLPAALALLALGAHTGHAASGRPDRNPDLVPERDALLAKIASGEDYEKSVERFGALLQERASRRQADQDLTARQNAERTQAQAAQKELEQSLDYIVGERCRLAVDPANRPPHETSDYVRADWGRVVQKQQFRYPPPNAFEEGRQIDLYRIQAVTGTYTVTSEEPKQFYPQRFSASVNDQVLLCLHGGSDHGSGSPFPPEFRKQIVSTGFVARIKGPPLIAQKGRWNPIHLLGESRLRMAIRAKKWQLPEDAYILNHLHVLEDLGPAGAVHRYLIAAEKESYVLEVPTGLKNRELLRPGYHAWVIMGQPRPDRERQTWILTAADIEAHYVVARD